MGTYRPNDSDEALPVEIGKILDDIEREPVPDRLLDLALQLQSALQTKRTMGARKKAAQHA
ncbi:hypothetical protein [Aquibium oceanicum]|uniref:Anti-sigma factor NepR domain-containing protein n=1 Tax=Aquibium oceanicum TaxID=1670800 RepID=A0A1L3SLW7_9HYPH|nr:hypothetical protein [Aquibium oceanicum]APH70351.1 hypothetical protein BSQ44_02360 [Aquibium oceanicum]